MAQSAPAVADISDGQWSPTPISPGVNFGSVTSSENENDTFQVKLAPMAWPASGPQSVSLTLQGAAGSSAGVFLMQGDAVVGSWLVNPPTTPQTFNFPLTQAQMDQITDYSNLSLTVASCPPLCNNCLMPQTIHMTWVDYCGSCCTDVLAPGVCDPASYATGEITLDYTGGGIWRGLMPNCTGGSPAMGNISLQCFHSDGWIIDGSIQSQINVNPDQWSCPLLIQCGDPNDPRHPSDTGLGSIWFIWCTGDGLACTFTY